MRCENCENVLLHICNKIAEICNDIIIKQRNKKGKYQVFYNIFHVFITY